MLTRTGLRRMNRTGSFCLFLVLVAACSPQVHPRSRLSEDVRSCLPHCMLMEELRRRAAAHPAPDSTSVRVREETSMVLPGVRYLWGEYRPPRSVHANFVALVASGDSVLIVRTPDDLASAAAGMVAVSSPDDAIRYCEEIIYTTSRRRMPGLRPRAYTGPASLEQLPLQVPDLQVLRDSLTIPTVNVDASDIWTADLWVIEPRDVVRVSCTVGPNRVAATVQDSFPGFGYLVR